MTSTCAPTPVAKLRWPCLAALAVTALLAAQVLSQSFGKPGFATDFQLLYTAASLWGDGGNPYDDAALKSHWIEIGDPALPIPGRPVTPNVYPLTIAPIIYPLTKLPFHHAVLVWTGVLLASFFWLAWYVLRTASTNRVRMIPVALAVGILLLGYPTRLNLASLNIGLATSALALWAITSPRSRFTAGIAMGLALLKYSITGPLWLLLLWRRRFSAAAIAVGVQVALVAMVALNQETSSPLHWVSDMRAEIAASLAPGAINAYDAAHGAAMHLGFRSLWHRLAPGVDWAHGILVALILFACISALIRRRATHLREADHDADAALLLAVTTISFYHRAYDLIPVIALTLAELLRREGEAPAEPHIDGMTTHQRGRRTFTEVLVWTCLALTVLPGLWAGWDSNHAPWLTRYFIQPACAWAALGLCVALTLTLYKCRASRSEPACPHAGTLPSEQDHTNELRPGRGRPGSDQCASPSTVYNGISIDLPPPNRASAPASTSTPSPPPHGGSQRPPQRIVSGR